MVGGVPEKSGRRISQSSRWKAERLLLRFQCRAVEEETVRRRGILHLTEDPAEEAEVSAEASAEEVEAEVSAEASAEAVEVEVSAEASLEAEEEVETAAEVSASI